jgi:RNA polymerase sigma factor (sigma-70 family)
MDHLIRQVLHYQSATDLEFKTRLAESILEAVIPKLRAHIHRELERDAAEEVFQTVLIAIVRGLAKFQGQTTSHFWSWCWQIARHKIADWIRAKARNREDAKGIEALWAAVEASAVDAPISAAERMDLNEAMERLNAANEPCHDYLWSHFFLGKGFVELGEVHGVNHGTMRQRIRRCLKLARKLALQPD